MKKFFRSFYYAWKGIAAAVREEQNMRFHLVAAFYVCLFAPFYGFAPAEKCVLALCIGGVLAMECLNSALERAVDRPGPERFYITGEVKDMAAGAVLLFAFCAGVCGVILFWRPAVLAGILRWFLVRPLCIGAFVASLAVAALFVFGKRGIR